MNLSEFEAHLEQFKESDYLSPDIDPAVKALREIDIGSRFDGQGNWPLAE
ncbi:hypothetical protein BH09VER1_BH09VER1_18230 [soil metagenome]